MVFDIVGIFKVADTLKPVFATKNPTIASDGVSATNKYIKVDFEKGYIVYNANNVKNYPLK